jgi:UDP-N-acetyl-D-glucosamine/UDP-N-acetyl-D-galactosamine dehydrogenase
MENKSNLSINNIIEDSKIKIAIIGLGYVGLPLAVEFGKFFNTLGFDLNNKRIKDLKKCKDSTEELTSQEIKSSSLLNFTSDEKSISQCNVFIIAVPTPINQKKKPDLTLLKRASTTVGKYLKNNDIVIYESTVYPGATEEICIPILEKKSKLLCKTKNNFLSQSSFGCGYSPERINPGDKQKTIKDIIKITSALDEDTSRKIDNLYKKIIIAGTCKVESIKIAEAAKIIENTQRDVNIALINEFSMIFNKMNIDTKKVLNAASSKWNFLPFEPGLVGGHCIGVDPYYLAYKAKKVGHNPKLLLSGRDINDKMGKHVAQLVVKGMKEKNIIIKNSKIIIFGITFKENCKDTRNSGVISLHDNLKSLGCMVSVFDPIATLESNSQLKNIYIEEKPKNNFYDCIILAVKHNYFETNYPIEKLKRLLKDKYYIFDLKSSMSIKDTNGRL